MLSLRMHKVQNLCFVPVHARLEPWYAVTAIERLVLTVEADVCACFAPLKLAQRSKLTWT